MNFDGVNGLWNGEGSNGVWISREGTATRGLLLGEFLNVWKNEYELRCVMVIGMQGFL